MLSSRPYLIRAMYEWIVDSELTPYVLVDAALDDVIIPREFVDDGKILLNISPGATQNLNLGDEYVLFNARFHGKSMEVSFPVDAVMSVYAKENGRGMMFKNDDEDTDPPNNTSSTVSQSSPGKNAPKKPSLKIVK